jgi:hypothetical protein
MHQLQFTRISRNSKTGPMPVTTTSEETCPSACPLKHNGCFADSGPLALLWRKVTERKAGIAWNDAMAQIAKLPNGTLWRHNQAGDLPGIGDAIDGIALKALVRANKGKRGFTYTHKPVSRNACPQEQANTHSVAYANAKGFAVNLSADTLAEADQLADLAIGPVVVVLPTEQVTATKTPNGRTVAICPAVLSDNVNCVSCGLCAMIDRKSIIGFPAHGTSKRKASAVAMGVN